MIILDTIFVRMSRRGKGHTRNLINQLLEAPDLFSFRNIPRVPNYPLGISSPISNGMFGLLIRMIITNGRNNEKSGQHKVSNKERLWLVCDMNDKRQNIWWTAQKLAKERQLDIRELVRIDDR